MGGRRLHSDNRPCARASVADVAAANSPDRSVDGILPIIHVVIRPYTHVSLLSPTFHCCVRNVRPLMWL